MTSPEEWGDKIVKRFRTTSESSIFQVLNSIDEILEKGKFSFDEMDKLMILKQWVEKIKNGNTIQS